MLKFVGRNFTGVLQYFPKLSGYLVQKLGEEKKNCQNPFPAILWFKKNFKKSYCHKAPRGG